MQVQERMEKLLIQKENQKKSEEKEREYQHKQIDYQQKQLEYQKEMQQKQLKYQREMEEKQLEFQKQVLKLTSCRNSIENEFFFHLECDWKFFILSRGRRNFYVIF